MTKSVSDIGILTETVRNLQVSVWFQLPKPLRPKFSVVYAGVLHWN